VFREQADQRGSRQGAVVTRRLPVVCGGETIEEAETVSLQRHLAQLVLQTYSVDVDSLMTQEHRLHIQRNMQSVSAIQL